MIPIIVVIIGSVVALAVFSTTPPPGMEQQQYSLVKTWGTEGSGNGQVLNPQGVAIDSSGSNMVHKPLALLSIWVHILWSNIRRCIEVIKEANRSQLRFGILRIWNH